MDAFVAEIGGAGVDAIQRFRQHRRESVFADSIRTGEDQAVRETLFTKFVPQPMGYFGISNERFEAHQTASTFRMSRWMSCTGRSASTIRMRWGSRRARSR